MKRILVKKGYDPSAVLSEGNMFLLGNGRLGYRGTLEEAGSDSKAALNIIGAYDRFGDKWRESVNAPNPLKAKTFYKGREISNNTETPLFHERKLNLSLGILSRQTEFVEATIKTERFVDKNYPDFVSLRYEVLAKNSGDFEFVSSIDEDVWDINGPHLKTIKNEIKENSFIHYLGETNEGSFCAVVSFVQSIFPSVPFRGEKESGLRFSFYLKKGEKASFIVSAVILFEKRKKLLEKADHVLKKYVSTPYGFRLIEHKKAWSNSWASSNVVIEGNREADFALRYSIYELLSLAPTKYVTSIPARGLSGQTYKGAIFWDTEMFMLPFFLLTDQKVALSLSEYRIKTLPGALKKATEFGQRGAFYAWESQDSGEEACSLYNVSDAVTGKPIRTYFADKQIHISGDVGWGIINTFETTNDFDLLKNGGLETLLRIAEFYIDYAQKGKDGLYHLNDVIGPDEYHERVNDNAYTNYLVLNVLKKISKILKIYSQKYPSQYNKTLAMVAPFSPKIISKFLNKLYVPLPQKNGLIEQFEGYFKKENVTLEEVRSRLKNPNEYWGGKRGVATPTQVIKQADVVTTLVTFPSEFDLRIKKANFSFYEPRTEHGSSLSACMYSLLASEVGNKDMAYRFFLNSAVIDLTGGGKQYAGSIYIGGTHPASSGGAYLSSVYGFAGLHHVKGRIHFKPNLPKQIKGMRIRFVEDGIIKEAVIHRRNTKIRSIKNV
jgi:trehalose/maltose hydrolase-like predicted phosphorylase